MSFFKNLFSSKGKPKDEPKIDYAVAEMRVGFILDYDFTSWIVEEVSTYNWSDGTKELEFTISSGSKKRYLNCNQRSENLSVFWEAKFDEVWSLGRSKVQNETIGISDSFHFDNRNFMFYANGEGEIVNSVESFRLKNWLFESEQQDYLVSFNKYEDNSSEVYVGKRLKRHEVSNILGRE
ncbi:MAG: DUF4178 domain-containing protein [Flavobacteriales bacterium]|nr:DUF4178 domain-containing protein [Flavobacteriales bacterium]